jgi:hypothetical protein
MPRLIERGKTQDVQMSTQTTFADLMVPDYIVKSLLENGINFVSPVQLEALPPARFGVGEQKLKLHKRNNFYTFFFFSSLQYMTLAHVYRISLIL